MTNQLLEEPDDSEGAAQFCVVSLHSSTRIRRQRTVITTTSSRKGTENYALTHCFKTNI